MATHQRMKHVNSETGQPAAETTGHFANEFRAQASAIGQDLMQLGGLFKSAAQERVGELRDNSASLLHQGQDSLSGYLRSAERYVHKQPLKAMCIAAGVGLVFGRLFLRK